MSGALQWAVRAITGGQDIGVGVELVRPVDGAGAGHRDGVAPERAALGGEEVVVAVALIEVGALGEADGRAFEDQTALPDQLPLFVRILLEDDSREAVLAGPVVPEHVEEVFAAVVVVE